MEEPKFKRPKLHPSLGDPDWERWKSSLELLQTKLLSGCLCRMESIELHKPLTQNQRSFGSCPRDYTLQFLATLTLLGDVASKEQIKGMVCSKIVEMTNSIALDPCIWDLLLVLLESRDKFISYAASKTIISLLFWAKTPNTQDLFDELFLSILPTASMHPPIQINPLRMTHTLDILRTIIEFKEDDHHPLEPISSLHITEPEDDPAGDCALLEIDSDLDVDIRTLCIKSLENYWTRLVIKIKNILNPYTSAYESTLTSFFNLWTCVVSVKSNLSVINTKHFYMNVEDFVPFLKPTLPPLIWRKILDVFNEILCYGSTLSLQEEIPEEPCNLAHVIIRSVKHRQFLQGVPYSKEFKGFGGSRIGECDWSGWESEIIKSSPFTKQIQPNFGPRQGSSKSTTSSFPPLKSKGGQIVAQTFYIQPDPNAIRLDPSFYEGNEGDRPLLQKAVLLVLKCLALTIKETGGDSDEGHSGGGSDESASESDLNDMIIIERSIRDVFSGLDRYIKSLLPYLPSAPLGECLVKLFEDQDDALIEGMLCSLDIFTGFWGKIQTPPQFYIMLNPTVIFKTFASAIGEDKDTLLDLLMSNETCFLLYLLQYLKFVLGHWGNFRESCGEDLERIMGMLIRLKMALDRLVERSLFPYNINPVIRLLEKIEDLYENGEGSIGGEGSGSQVQAISSS